jgi:hypothetical protein
MTGHEIGFMRHKFVHRWEEEMTRNKNAISDDIVMTVEDQQRKPPLPVDVMQSLLPNLKIAQSFTGSFWKGYGSNLPLSLLSLPNVRWEDIGGLESIQKEIMDAVELLLKYPLLFKGS